MTMTKAAAGGRGAMFPGWKAVMAGVFDHLGGRAGRVLAMAALALGCGSLGAVFGDAPARAQTGPGAEPIVSGELLDAGGGPLEIVVSGVAFEPIPIAIPRFVAADPSMATMAEQITEVILGDLQRSGLFVLTESGPLASIDVPPDFGALKAAGAAALLAGEVGQEPDGRLGVRFRLWDVELAQQLEQLQLLADPTGWRRMAHKVADSTYTELTGEDPYFDSRIVFVDESGPKDARRKRLAIMDQDGAKLVYLTSDEDLVLTPRFSPAEQAITFISYAEGEPQIYLLNLTTERQEALGNFPGMTFAPRFSPDGDRVVMSLTRGGDTDIYIMDLATRRLRRLTSSAGIETAPSFAPDGSAIAFESDRGGSQQIYVMAPDGSNQRRISFGEGRYATPVWSPKGDLIAFTKMLRGRFHIGVMRPDGSDERLLTGSFLDEGPTWAPNGRVLMFFREGRGAAARPELYTIDIYGRNLQRVPTPNGASDPAWSPILTP